MDVQGAGTRKTKKPKLNPFCCKGTGRVWPMNVFGFCRGRGEGNKGSGVCRKKERGVFHQLLLSSTIDGGKGRDYRSSELPQRGRGSSLGANRGGRVEFLNLWPIP